MEPPGGMKGKDGAVTSTYHLNPLLLSLSIWAHMHSLYVQCILVYVQPLSSPSTVLSTSVCVFTLVLSSPQWCATAFRTLQVWFILTVIQPQLIVTFC